MFLVLLIFLFLIVSCASENKNKQKFLWGVAISGFQADMGPNSEPDKNSDWWIWTHNEENFKKGYYKDVPENSSDFWTHYKADIDIAKDVIGVDVFRYGMEWSRVFPNSTTSVKVSFRTNEIGYPLITIDEKTISELDNIADQKSVKKYREILAYMKQKGLKIFITLNHFSLPYWIHDPIACRDWISGITINAEFSPEQACFGKPSGWISSQTVVEFAKYVAYVVSKFGDLVDMWGPINEPIVVATGGYLFGGISGPLGFGAFPPAGSNKQSFEYVLKNLIFAHAIAYDTIHKFDKEDADKDGVPTEVFLIYNISYIDGDDQRAVDSAWKLLVWDYLDAVLRGKINSQFVRELYKKADIIGINYYNRFQVIYVPVFPSVGMFFAPKPCPSEEPSDVCPYGRSEMGYELYPPGIYEVIKAVWERYRDLNIPILITENGLSDSQDKKRGIFIQEHLRYVRKALDEGIPVLGYFYWSLIDNLEWALGFEKRFGLVFVDFSSPERKRTIKSSAYVFSDEIKNWRKK